MNSASSLELTKPVSAVEPAVSSEDSQPVQSSGRHQPDVSQLEDRVPGWAQLTRPTLIWTCLLGLVWLFLNYQPVWHTDIWGHLYYGRLIVEQRSIPATEPALPLAEGVPFQDTAWLSQVIGYLAYSQQGVTSLRFLYALCLTTCLVALLVRFRERTSSIALSLLGMAVFLVVVWKSLHIVRPQLAGLVCYVLLISLVMRRHWHRSFWLAIPAIFLVWANLHGSFPIGIGLLTLLCLGRAGDIWGRTGSWKALFRDEQTRRWFLVTQLALMAVLVNPYGIGIFSAVQSVSSSPNLRSLIEWEPVTLRMNHGQGFAVATLLLLLVYRWTPRRVSLAEVLLLCGFGLAALWSVRMMVWWTPLAAWYLVLHGGAILKQRQQRFERMASAQALNTVKPAAEEEEEEEEASPVGQMFAYKSGMNTVLTLGLLWIFFGYTPFGATLLHGYPTEPAALQRHFKQNVSRETPVDLVNYLHQHPMQGLIFNTYEWGDYLLWAGPEDLKIYLNSHAHLLPMEIWQDYFVIANASSGWEDKLDRYGINTVLVKKNQSTRLTDSLRRNPGWTLDYEDPLGAIFKRNAPIVNQ